MSSTIVVGVDGSADSGLALDWAGAEAALHGTGLVVVHGLFMPVVAVPFGGAAVLPPSDQLRESATRVLDAARARVAQAWPALDVDTFLVLRRPVEALLEVAGDASMIVVGTRGLGGLSGIIGSVSGRVAARSRCPTVVVPPVVAPDDGSIVVGVDGSSCGDAALEFALAEAERRQAKVVAVHAYTAAGTAGAAAADSLGGDGLVPAALERARAATVTDPGVSIRVDAGRPADVLLDAGRDAALIVVGSRGRGPLRGRVLGSTSNAVLHRAVRPVAVVRGDDGDS